jgi:hypothetical protein
MAGLAEALDATAGDEAAGSNQTTGATPASTLGRMPRPFKYDDDDNDSDYVSADDSIDSWARNASRRPVAPSEDNNDSDSAFECESGRKYRYFAISPSPNATPGIFIYSWRNQPSSGEVTQGSANPLPPVPAYDDTDAARVPLFPADTSDGAFSSQDANEGVNEGPVQGSSNPLSSRGSLRSAVRTARRALGSRVSNLRASTSAASPTRGVNEGPVQGAGGSSGSEPAPSRGSLRATLGSLRRSVGSRMLGARASSTTGASPTTGAQDVDQGQADEGSSRSQPTFNGDTSENADDGDADANADADSNEDDSNEDISAENDPDEDEFDGDASDETPGSGAPATQGAT